MSDYSWVTDEMFDEKLEQIVADRYGGGAMQLVHDHAPDAWSDIRESLNNEVLGALEEERIPSPDPFEVERRVDAVIPSWYESPCRASRSEATREVVNTLREMVLITVEAALDVAEEADPRVDWGVHVLGESADHLLTERADTVTDTSLSEEDLIEWVRIVLELAPEDYHDPVADCHFAIGLRPEKGLRQMMEGVYCHHITQLAREVVRGLVEGGVLVREEDLPEPEEEDTDE